MLPVLFLLCLKNCTTCPLIVKDTSFKSSVNGTIFEGVYEFGENEERILSCKSVNCIYMLECTTCGSQYVGETVQKIKDRIAAHRGTTVPGKSSGNFRLRQHYACSGGYCTSFKIYIVQKLKGTGRLDVLQENSSLYKIDSSITKERKLCEDNWIRKLYTQYPYGCNDRIDSLENKGRYNCEFAKFISCKSKRKRSWGNSGVNSNDNIDISTIVDELLCYLNYDFNTKYIKLIQKLLFSFKRSILIKVKNDYLDKVFLDEKLKHEVLRRHMHFVIID